MKRILVLTILISSLASQSVFSQEEVDDKLFGIRFSGLVKNDFILDSRQIVSARDGHFLLYPKNVKLDVNGEDVNARPTFNYLAIQSRLTATITGPKAFGAETLGVLEGAFFGQDESNINTFRLRHAYIKMNWENTELLFGQYWHMMFVTGCFPATISFNTGAPIQFFSRNPQIRITHKLGVISLSGSAATQLDFVSPGGRETLSNAVLPDLSGRISYETERTLLGLAIGYKRLLPRLETEKMYKTSETVGGFTAQAFYKYMSKPITFKIQTTYAQNGFDGLQIGGFAIRSITDVERDFREYTTINTVGIWNDIHTNDQKVQVGLFSGYIKNLGSIHDINDLDLISTFVRGSNIAYLYRVAPRIVLNSGKLRVAAEIEHTAAAYGDAHNSKGVPQNAKVVADNRMLVAIYYFF